MTEKKVITAQAQGHNGPIDLEIGVENQEIVNVDVKKHSETKGIFNQVFSKLRADFKIASLMTVAPLIASISKL